MSQFIDYCVYAKVKLMLIYIDVLDEQKKSIAACVTTS